MKLPPLVEQRRDRTVVNQTTMAFDVYARQVFLGRSTFSLIMKSSTAAGSQRSSTLRREPTSTNSQKRD